jgi:phage gp29-like protein
MRRPRGTPRTRTILSADGASSAVWLDRAELEKTLLDEPLGWNGMPLSVQTRRYFGSALSPATIETVIRNAELGYMRDMADLIHETIAIDPTLGSAIGKRFRKLASVFPTVEPATGDGIDPAVATYFADVVRQQLKWIPNLRQAVTSLNWAHCHGRAALEKVWRENPAGKVRWRVEALKWIHPRRLHFGPERELRVSDDPWSNQSAFEAAGLELRRYPSKFITYLPQLFGEYPEREGFGPRALYWSFFKRFSTRERLILLEVFGKPWRIVSVDPAYQGPIDKTSLDEAVDAIDAMGANATGRLPAGFRCETTQPGQNAGQVHREVKEDANDEILKLVLGETRTTDAKPGALGSSGDEVAQDEQTSVVAADGWGIAEVLTEQLAVDIIALNFGPDALDHCPTISLAYEPPPNREREVDRVVKAFSLPGFRMKQDEVYEAMGFTKPSPSDEVFEGQAPEPGGLPGLSGFGDGGDSGASPLGDGGGVGPVGDNGQPVEDEAMTAARAIRVFAQLDRLSQQTKRRGRRRKADNGTPPTAT